MAAPPDALQAPAERRRPRTRVHIDFEPERTAENGHGPDFEMHIDLFLTSTGAMEVMGQAFSGAFRGLGGAGRDQNNDRMIDLLTDVVRARFQGAGGAPAVNPVAVDHYVNGAAGAVPANGGRIEVRFTPLANGSVRCQACTPPMEMPEGSAAAHAREVHHAGQIHEETVMRRVVDPPPAADPVPGEGMVVAGTVEDAAEGIVRVDGAVGSTPVDGVPGIVRCNGCGVEIGADWFQTHAEAHLRARPDAVAAG